MAGQGKLCKFFTLIGNYRNVLTNNRLTVAPCYFQKADLKTGTKDRLESLKIPKNPKRPLSAYFRFLAERRPLVQKQHPDWKLVDITKHCAQEWKNVSPDEKEKYQTAYTKEMLAYDEEHKKYTASLTEEQSEALRDARKEKRESKQKRTIKKRFRETDKPKRPAGSFLFFIKEKWALPENKDKKLTEMLKTFSDEWKSLPTDKKEKFTKMHHDEKVKYEQQMVEWEAKMVEEGNTDIIRKASQFIASSKPLPAKSPKPLPAKSPKPLSTKIPKPVPTESPKQKKSR